jgi:creatinine amidohydrolase
MHQIGTPWRLKDLTSAAVRALTAERPWLIVPVGALESRAPELPLGAASFLVERLGDDLSARFRIPRAPLVALGVNRPGAGQPGAAGLQRKTLHRVMNELIAAWEASAGIEEFVILSGQEHAPHQEALGTIRPLKARVQVVDLSDFDLSQLPGAAKGDTAPRVTWASLLLYVAPDLVTSNGGMLLPTGASAELGERTYTFMLELVASRCFPFPAVVS